MRQLVESPALRTACPVPFDEARLWQGQEGGDALEEGPERETQYECQLGEGVGRLIVRGLLLGGVHGMGKLSHDGGRCKR